MRALLLAGAVAATVSAAGAAQAASELQIKDAAVRVIVIPENRPDVKVEVTKSHGALPMRMWVDGDTVRIDGDLDRNGVRGCDTNNGRASIRIRGKGPIAYDDLPLLTVHTPMDVKVRAGGAVFGEIRNAGSVELGNAGCGDWTIGDARGAMKLRQAGSGDLAAGRSGSLQIRVAGSGDVKAGASAGDVDVHIAGSGDAQVASVGGVLNAKIAGSGDIRVDGGRAREMNASIAGSGGVKFGGEAGALKANIAGSGDISALRVSGPVERRIVGSGDIRIGQ